MTVFKRIGGGNHIVEPFEVNASHSFVWTSGSTTADGFSINLANQDFENDPRVYVTTVGLYNDANELLAVAKLSRPLEKSFHKEALLRVRLDF